MRLDVVGLADRIRRGEVGTWELFQELEGVFLQSPMPACCGLKSPKRLQTHVEKPAQTARILILREVSRSIL